MKQIIQNELTAHLHLKMNEQNLDEADIAFLCCIMKINEIKAKRFGRR